MSLEMSRISKQYKWLQYPYIGDAMFIQTQQTKEDLASDLVELGVSHN